MNTSQYGTARLNPNGTFHAKLTYNGQMIHLGDFSTYAKARKAIDSWKPATELKAGTEHGVVYRPRFAVFRNNKLVDLVRVQGKKAISISQSKLNRKHTQSIYFNGTEPRLDSGCDFQLVTGNPCFPGWSDMVGKVAKQAKSRSSSKSHSADIKREVIEARNAGRSLTLLAKDYRVTKNTICRWLREAEIDHKTS